MADTTVMIDGTTPQAGATLQVDHVETTFELTVLTTLGPIGWQDLKDLIQRKYKVVDMKRTGTVTYCKSTSG